jgi:hypothetical protein
MLGLDGVRDYISGGEQNEPDMSGDTEMLADCANFVISEVAAEYIPVYKTESVTPINGMIEYAQLSERIIGIKDVTCGGQKARFGYGFDGINVDSASAHEVTYAFAPLEGTLESVLPWKGGKPAVRTLGYGIAAEYCLINGMFDEAAMWDKIGRAHV